MKAPKYFYFRVHADYRNMKVELEDASDVDVVEVVRCKDCAYYNTTGCSDGFGWCEDSIVNTGTTDDFFCARGIKKDGNGDN